MTGFEIVDNPTPEPSEELSYMDSCDCKTAGDGQPVLLSVDDGSIGIVCANCRRSLAFLDDLELVSSDEIPMTLTYHDTTRYYPEPECDGYWQLTPRDEPVDVARTAAIPDQLQDAANVVSHITAAAGGGS